MHVILGFTGAARDITKRKELTLSLENNMTYQDITRLLGVQYPELIGLIIDQDRQTLLSGNLLVINGDLTNPAMVMSESPKDGDRLILMSVISGGKSFNL
ncbi:MAG: MoaD/ThiS family protein [Anaerolineaceae bacterium]|nr:MoaD/ThiS family protein [Anaerolineaceae bacterium]